jgi:Na+/citrate or Na+/malate symporter
VLATTCFLLAYVIAGKILPAIGGISIHYFAWMVLIVAALNASGPARRRLSRRQTSV